MLFIYIATLAAFFFGNYVNWPTVVFPSDEMDRDASFNRGAVDVITRAARVPWIMSVGGLAGAIMAGVIADRFGRKRTIVLISLLMFSCWWPVGLALDFWW